MGRYLLKQIIKQFKKASPLGEVFFLRKSFNLSR